MSKRRVLVTTGYMGSGSSAATDLISEFKNVNNKHADFEYVFLHCPNGVFDLEDKLLIGNNSIRSDEAIHSFLKEMKDLYNLRFWWPGYYKKIIGNNFYDEVLKYVDSLVDFESNNYWYYQEKPTKSMQFKTLINYATKRILRKKCIIKKQLRYNKMLLSYKTKEEFYKQTKIFINKILNMIDNTNQDILLDQLLLPQNIKRMDNYFDEDEIKVIVVERDPRDVFILNKYAWAKKGIDVPYSFDVKKFCIQYKNIRRMEQKTNNKNVLRLKFEDLVYDYDRQEKKIAKFLGCKLEDHVNKFKRFDPKISIRNTQVFRSNKEYEKECKYIEKELKEYLYDFKETITSKIEDTIN